MDTSTDTRPRPYYAADGITIYHGDCRNLLPGLAIDAIVTDPPYGTGWARGGQSIGMFTARHEQPAWDVFSLGWIDWAPVKFWLAFCPNSRASAMAQRATARVHWRKTNPRPNGPESEPIFLWPIFLPDGLEWVGYNGDTPDHPCQKPTALLAWLLRFCDPAWVVCDPFVGAGSTLVAAKRLGRAAIGIEQEERYCEIAAERLAQRGLAWE